MKTTDSHETGAAGIERPAGRGGVSAALATGLCLVLAGLAGCKATPQESRSGDGLVEPGAERDAGATFGVLTPAELHAALARKDFLLINVKVPPVGIIPGTDASIGNEATDALAARIGPDLHARVVLYCRTRPRALAAAAALAARGYTRIAYLDGGVTGWREAGYAVD